MILITHVFDLLLSVSISPFLDAKSGKRCVEMHLHVPQGGDLFNHFFDRHRKNVLLRVHIVVVALLELSQVNDFQFFHDIRT